MPSERQQMLAGLPYDSRDPELLAAAHRARALLARFNALSSVQADERHDVLVALLGGVGRGVWIEPPFFCDYGSQITIGDDSFLNVNCVLLDSAEIRVGSRALIGPGVQLLTASHPLNARERSSPDHGRSPYRTFARPIRIGDDCWIGAGALVMPGVTIGDNTTIGAGSVVTADVPANVLAFGNPCRVQRAL